MVTYTAQDLSKMSPAEFRSLVRKGEWTQTNRDACRGYAHAGLVAIPQEYAGEFLLFCQRNPRPCPLLDVTEPGDPRPLQVAPGADLRTDLPRYRVFKDGEIIDEPTDATRQWRKDLVGFVIGCSRGIDYALFAAGIGYRLIGIYNSNIALAPAGRFRGYMAVGCRAFSTSTDAIKAVQISARHTAFHGPPVHIGNPELIGIKDMRKTDFPLPYESEPPGPTETALFWGCAVTPQSVAQLIKVPFMIASYEGHLFVTDRLVEELALK